MEMLQEKSDRKMTESDATDSDKVVERQLDGSLGQYFFFAPQRVNWECHDGVVVLRGQVNTFHEKQMAQELARRVAGVRVVINRLNVSANATSRIVDEALLSARNTDQLASRHN